LGEHRYNVTLFRPILLFGTPVPKKEEVTIEFTGFDEQHRDLRSRHSREYWPALFQRAYLKLNAVNMDSWKTPDGDNHYASPAIALFQLTGRVAERWDPNARNSQADLIDLVHQRRPLVAGTPSKEGKRLMPNSLMVYDHSYTIVAADEGGVTLRNPWGHDTDVERYRLIEPSGEGLRIRSPKAALPRLGFVDGFTDGLGDNPLDGLIKLDWPTFRRDIKNVWYIPPIVQAQRQRHGGGMR
jgi:hypothetical protein